MAYETLQASVDKLHGMFDRTDIDMEWKKIEQKLREAKFNRGDVRPLADCLFSILLAARSEGYSVEAAMKELDRVAEDNLRREWKQMPDGTYQAI
jgi:hypothetical protein